jgi:DNA-directed RNA polymerase I subunit RPA2
MRKGEFLIPTMIMLKCLKDVTDLQLCNMLGTGRKFLEILLLETSRLKIFTQIQALTYLGSKFRVTLKLPPTLSDAEVGEILIKEHILVHLDSFEDKFNFMLLMLDKLYALALGVV